MAYCKELSGTRWHKAEQCPIQVSLLVAISKGLGVRLNDASRRNLNHDVIARMSISSSVQGTTVCARTIGTEDVGAGLHRAGQLQSDVVSMPCVLASSSVVIIPYLSLLRGQAIRSHA